MQRCEGCVLPMDWLGFYSCEPLQSSVASEGSTPNTAGKEEAQWGAAWGPLQPPAGPGLDPGLTP